MPTTVTSNLGTVYHLWQLPELSAKEVSPGIQVDELRNKLGNGYRSQVLYGAANGLRSWSLTLPTLADFSVLPNTVTGPDGETLSREAYLWELYMYTRRTGMPFVYTCPRNGRQYLVDFTDPKLQYAKQAYVKLYSTGLEIEQVREDGETVFSPIGLAGLDQYYTDASDFPTVLPFPIAGDAWVDSAGTGNLGAKVFGDVVKATAVQNGQDVVRFSNTTNNGYILNDNGMVVKEAFFVMKMRESTFSNNAGILTGSNTTGVNAALIGESGTTKFFNLTFGSNYQYRLNNTAYIESNQQAPMNAFGIVHIRHLTGITLDKIQIGWDRDIPARFAEVDIGEALIFDAIQPTSMVGEIYENLSVKWGIAIA